MKNIVLLRILIIFIASAIFVSCSKENLSSGENNISGTKSVPVSNYGEISGRLSPVPSYASLKLYNEFENVTSSGFVNPDGTFRVNVISGTYHVVVIYTPSGTPPGEYSYFEIRGVMVESGKVTDLGVINLLPQ